MTEQEYTHVTTLMPDLGWLRKHDSVDIIKWERAHDGFVPPSKIENAYLGTLKVIRGLTGCTEGERIAFEARLAMFVICRYTTRFCHDCVTPLTPPGTLMGVVDLSCDRAMCFECLEKNRANKVPFAKVVRDLATFPGYEDEDKPLYVKRVAKTFNEKFNHAANKDDVKRRYPYLEDYVHDLFADNTPYVADPDRKDVPVRPEGEA